MVRKITTIISLCVMCLSIAGCHRQKLEEIVYTKALIPVLIDWETRSLLYADDDPDENLYSASVWLFPREGSKYQGAPIEYRLSNAIYDYIEVPVGVYDVLVFNKTVGEYSSNVGFRGTDKFETFEYYTKPYVDADDAKVYDGEQELRLEPDLLAAWRSEDDEPLVVTIDMIHKMSDIILCRDYLDGKYLGTKSEATDALEITPSDFEELGPEMQQLIDLKPERLTHITPITEWVKNLHSAKVAVGTLCGMSSSVKLASAEYSTTQTAHKFLFDKKTIVSDDKKDGYMEAEFRVIGPLHMDEKSDYDLKSNFTLHEEHDGSMYFPVPPSAPISWGVNDQVYYWQERLSLEKIIPVEVELDQAATLPDVEFGSEGFDVNINGWDDEINIPL